MREDCGSFNKGLLTNHSKIFKFFTKIHFQEAHLVFPDNLNDIDLVCRAWNEFVDCLRAYTETCFTDMQKRQFNRAVESPIESVHQMCMQPAYQKGKCFLVKFPSENYNSLTFRIPPLCTMYQKYGGRKSPLRLTVQSPCRPGGARRSHLQVNVMLVNTTNLFALVCSIMPMVVPMIDLSNASLKKLGNCAMEAFLEVPLPDLLSKSLKKL